MNKKRLVGFFICIIFSITVVANTPIDSLIISRKSCHGEIKDKFHLIQIVTNEKIDDSKLEQIEEKILQTNEVREMVDSLTNEIIKISPRLKDSIEVIFYDRILENCKSAIYPCISRTYEFKSISKSTPYDVVELKNALVDKLQLSKITLEKLIVEFGQPDSIIQKNTDIGISQYFYSNGLLFYKFEDFMTQFNLGSIDFRTNNHSITLDNIEYNKNTDISTFQKNYPLAYLNMYIYKNKEGVELKEIHLRAMYNGNIYDDYRLEFVFLHNKLIRLKIIERLT